MLAFPGSNAWKMEQISVLKRVAIYMYSHMILQLNVLFEDLVMKGQCSMDTYELGQVVLQMHGRQ